MVNKILILLSAIVLLLLASLTAPAQPSALRFTPSGVAKSIGSTMTLTNTMADTTIFADTLLGRQLAPGANYRFELYCSIRSTLVSVPTLSIKLFFGTDSIVVLNGLSVGGLLTTGRPIIIRGTIQPRADGTQYLYCEVDGKGGAIPSLTNGAAAQDKITSIVLSNQNVVRVKAKFGALSITTFLDIKQAYRCPI